MTVEDMEHLTPSLPTYARSRLPCSVHGGPSLHKNHVLIVWLTHLDVSQVPTGLEWTRGAKEGLIPEDECPCKDRHQRAPSPRPVCSSKERPVRGHSK